MEKKLNNFSYEYLYSYHVEIGALYRMPESPFGLRTIGIIDKGTVWGDKVNGVIESGGGDWCVMRPDGVSVPDVRLVIRTDDGAYIYMKYVGKMDAGENGYENYKNSIYPEYNFLGTLVELETDDPRYTYLNRTCCFGIGKVHRISKTEVELQYDVYSFRALPDDDYVHKVI